MRGLQVVANAISAAIVALVLTGCGDSTPIPPTTGAPTNAYAPSSGAFVMISATELQNVQAVDTCNLDAINGQPAGGQTLAHASKALFAGWAANAADGSIPKSIQLILEGAKAYSVTAATGQPRPDVAKANKMPRFANAGWQVNADLPQVAPGDYKVILRYQSGGKPVRCMTQVKLTVK